MNHFCIVLNSVVQSNFPRIKSVNSQYLLKKLNNWKTLYAKTITNYWKADKRVKLVERMIIK